MTDNQNRDAHDGELTALIALLDTCGADPARWPTGAEARFAKLIAANPHAQSAVAEAKALDRTLDLAPRVAPAREAALMRQIMAQTRSITGGLAQATNATSTPWPPSEAAIQGPPIQMPPGVFLDGRLKPDHGVMADVGDGQDTRAPKANVVPMRIPHTKQPARAATQGYGLMAAALLLGIIVGAGGLVSPVLDTVAETVGITEDGSELAFVPDLNPSEEDTL